MSTACAYRDGNMVSLRSWLSVRRRRLGGGGWPVVVGWLHVWNEEADLFVLICFCFCWLSPSACRPVIQPDPILVTRHSSLALDHATMIDFSMSPLDFDVPRPRWPLPPPLVPTRPQNGPMYDSTGKVCSTMNGKTKILLIAGCSAGESRSVVESSSLGIAR